MRPLEAVTICLLLGTIAGAQAPSVPTGGAANGWGGRAVPAQVPYQPTLAAESLAPASGAASYGLPLNGVNAVTVGTQLPGQAYTLHGPVALPAASAGSAANASPMSPSSNATAPGATPFLAPQQPVFPEPAPSGLRPLPRSADAREGFFQRARFTAGWIPQLDEDGLGWTDLRSEISVGLPFFTRETPILITPSYELHFLDRPTGVDLPPRLHDLVIDFNHFRRVADNWIANIAVAPGYYADDHSFDSSDALRINGRALAIYDPTPEWKGILGFTYVHGGWAKVVPVAGVVYEPNDDVKYELVFPRPRVAWRLPNSPVPGRDEWWFYLLGEFANAIWAIEQDDGTPDMFAYRDWRLMLGLEHKIIGGLSSRCELGYVFNREYKLASDGGEIELDDSLLVRVGLMY